MSTRVLIVDDSVVVRRIVRDALDETPGLEVCGTSANGLLALKRIPLLKPDIILLDIAMPELDGLETVQRLRARGDQTPVVIFSSMGDARIAVEAIERGANECLAKPTVKNLGAAKQYIMDTVAPVLLGLDEASHTPRPAILKPPKPAPRPKRPKNNVPPQAVVVASSTGGPNALGRVIPKLPADFHLPILLVQHMPPVFTGILAERLNKASAINVVEAKQDMPVLKGNVYIAPGGLHMEVRGTVAKPRIHLHEGPLTQSCRPAADVLFKSAVKVYRSRLFGVVLTGMGADGLAGSKEVVEAGGSVITQDAKSCVVYGMPRQVYEHGLSDAAIDLEKIAENIIRRTSARRSVPHARPSRV